MLKAIGNLLAANLKNPDGTAFDRSGVFTPTVKGSTTAGSPTYGAATAGFWVKKGNLVTVQGLVALTNKGGMVGNISLEGLPFATLSTANYVVVSRNIATNDADLTAFYAANGQTGIFLMKGTGASFLVDTDITDTFYFYFNVTYTTN